MVKDKIYLIITLILLTPGIAHAHNPAAGILITFGILLVPGFISALLVERNGIVWFSVSIPLAIFCIWIALSEFVPFYFGCAIPFTLIPMAFWHNARTGKTNPEQQNNET